jgi:hypothetical protein
MATSADYTAVMAIGKTVDISTRKLQSAVNKVTILVLHLQPLILNRQDGA